MVRQGHPRRRPDQLHLRALATRAPSITLGGNSGFVKKPEQYLQNEKDDWYKRYHVFSVEWSPLGYIFRIDGQETGRINKGVSGVAEYPILSLLSSDYELKKLGLDEKKPAPDDERRLDPHLAGPGALSRRRRPLPSSGIRTRPGHHSVTGPRRVRDRLDWSTGKLSGSSHQRSSGRATLAAWVGAQAPKVDPTPPTTTWRNPRVDDVRSGRPIAARPRGRDASRGAAPPSPPSSQTSEAAAQQEATISVLPGIVQPGRKTANADKALAAVVATFVPAKKGRAVDAPAPGRQQVGRRGHRRPGPQRQGRVRRAGRHRHQPDHLPRRRRRRRPASARSPAGRSAPPRGARRPSPTSSPGRR